MLKLPSLNDKEFNIILSNGKTVKLKNEFIDMNNEWSYYCISIDNMNKYNKDMQENIMKESLYLLEYLLSKIDINNKNEWRNIILKFKNSDSNSIYYEVGTSMYGISSLYMYYKNLDELVDEFLKSLQYSIEVCLYITLENIEKILEIIRK